MKKLTEEKTMTQTITLQNTKRKRKLDPNIIRKDDNVRIIIPECVDRVGYPLTKKDIINEMTPEQKQALKDFLAKTFGITLQIFNSGIDYPTVNDEILEVVASRILCQRRWGGNERTLHTKTLPSHCIGQVSRVFSKKTVKTGKYHNGSGGYDYYTGEWDWTPAYLENEKTHVLYQIDVLVDSSLDGCINSHKLLYFERRCIEKVIYNPHTGNYEPYREDLVKSTTNVG